MFCKHCGNEVNENADVCLSCGRCIKENATLEANKKAKGNPNTKTIIISGLLALLLGPLGAHNFYLKHWVKAGIQLAMTICGCILYVIGIACATSKVIELYGDYPTDAQILEITQSFSTIFLIATLIFAVVRIWTLIESILCFCGVVKDGKGNPIK